MRASLLLDADPSTAARRANDILANFPGHAAAALLLATARRRLGDPASAAALLESLATAEADSPVVQLELGRAYAAAGRNVEAASAFRRAVTLDAGLADGWRELAAQLHAAGDTLAGDRAYARYGQLSPAPPELSDAIVALAANRLQAAGALLRQRLRLAPRDVKALHLLAQAAARLEDDVEAERCLKECLALAPGFAAARYDLARLLNMQQRVEEMLPHVERLLALDPGNIDFLSLKAQGLRFAGRTHEAVALMEQLLADHPDVEQSWILCGGLLREIGEPERAVEMFRRALAVRPGSAVAYSSLADLKTFHFHPSDIAAMQQQLALGTVRGADRIRLEFALAKGLEDAREFATSFEHYASGNRMQRATFYYDAQTMTAEVEASRSFYAERFFRERPGWGSERPDPIFIIGLPRSGSTLLEQMLASHSQVEATRELFDLPHLVFELVSGVAEPTQTTLHERIGALTRAEMEAFAGRYLERVQRQRPLGKARFIDKLPGNWCFVGLIHLLFPRAAIIDARRHPLGCGFSCYKQLFARGQKYAYDLGELGRFYRDHVALMEHFDATLPGRVHRVYYEQLVADPEKELRRLLDYCGLPFEEQCLRFYETRRAVTTISSEQVRRPIYGESVDHWRHYEPWLGPLKEVVGELVARYPAAAPAAA
jgi:predicted Zn-dependent protease